MVALPQIRCQLHDHAKQYDNDGACHNKQNGGKLHGNIYRNGYGNAIIGRYGGCFEEGITSYRNSIAQGHRCGHDLDSDISPFQRDFPEIWHDTPGQYIKCTCKLTTGIIIMTNNIMILNQLNTMQQYISNML